nr:MAG TPA: hypothetical protein [Caudoviricetes sp.]
MTIAEIMIDRVGAISKRKAKSYGTARLLKFLRKVIF